MVDEKKCYFFGRNPTLNDVLVDHQSCSRVHAALIYHKVLERNFLIDLGSSECQDCGSSVVLIMMIIAHGTFIGNTRIEPKIPTQLPLDTSFHFGASTRIFTLRDKPIKKRTGDAEMTEDGVNIVSTALPVDEIELDNLTEYNTLNNKRITMIGITDVDGKDEESGLRSQNVKRKRESVRFKEVEDIINPEDVDPSVGKFRNLIQTEIVTSKRVKLDTGGGDKQHNFNILRPDHEMVPQDSASGFSSLISNSLSIKLGIHLPNPAPNVDDDHINVGHSRSDLGDANAANPSGLYDDIGVDSKEGSSNDDSAEKERKKKYAKEAWPGRKPPGLF